MSACALLAQSLNRVARRRCRFTQSLNRVARRRCRFTNRSIELPVVALPTGTGSRSPPSALGRPVLPGLDF
ncbi:hypothetical protein BC827DRAFT_1207908, partial [Russula dissimulans]